MPVIAEPFRQVRLLLMTLAEKDIRVTRGKVEAEPNPVPVKKLHSVYMFLTRFS